jgi:hypothetical protein
MIVEYPTVVASYYDASIHEVLYVEQVNYNELETVLMLPWTFPSSIGMVPSKTVAVFKIKPKKL